jgi:hypothetical protein
MMQRWFWLLAACLLLAQCNDTVEKEREVGYRGKARVNPFLAFERFVQKHSGQEVTIQHTWQELDDSKSMIILPIDLLSSQLSVDQVKEWVDEGGHAVFLLDNSAMYLNDWSGYEETSEVPDALNHFFEELGVDLEEKSAPQTYDTVLMDDETYEVELRSQWKLLDEEKNPQGVMIYEWGNGLVTLVTDARLMRNRTIDQKQHIELIAQLLEWRREEGEIVFMQGVGISFFGLLWQKGWMALLGLGVLIAAWLLRHMPRFGPQQSGLREDQIRAYDHHLEMIGDFHWRLDRGASLLQPLRVELQEICHSWQSKHGRLDERLFDVMASRAEIPVDRVERAMTEMHARDNLIFTRTVADLQHIRKAFA